jgi:hypothetical protein
MSIRGTFYPSDDQQRGGSISSVLPKVLVGLLALIVVRNVLGAKRRHGGSSRWGGRREAIAEFHRALHAEDAAGPGNETANKV